MHRDLFLQLTKWKTSPLRVPLIIRGARQVGKSWLVQSFAKTFSHFAEINFEAHQGAKVAFEGDLIASDILEKLSLYCGKKIVPGKTLLFLDEIQYCESAIQALRYFKENCPELHVIAAGSLLDFTLEKVGMPVGRVQFMYLYPLSFGEFLVASGKEQLRDLIVQGKTDAIVHNIMMDHLKTYMWLGGMPEVVKAWLEFKDPQLCQSTQERIITAYQQDFSKYSKKNQIEYVSKVFTTVPMQLGRKLKYTNIDRDIKSYHLKQAFHLLVQAGIIYPCYHSTGQHIPLGATKNLNRFKAFFFDIGLAQRLLGLDLKQWVTTPLEVKKLGSITEQLVAQEMIAYADYQKSPEIFYWHREEKNSNAEVDFLFCKNNQIIPVEVKSGTKGGLKSLNLFLHLHPQTPYGLKVYECMQQQHYNNVTEVPLYGLEGWLGITA